MNMSKSRIVMIVVSLMLVICLLIVVPISVYFVITKLVQTNEYEFVRGKRSYRYKTLQVNSETKEVTSFGVISLFDKFGSEEFRFTQNDNQKEYTLISNFGSSEYQCTGKCFCDTTISHDRRATQVISKGLFYLVASVSAVFATNIAIEYFQDECEKQFESDSTCDITSVRSEVDKCESIMNEQVNEEEYEPEVEVTTREYKKREDRYLCSGKCRMHNIFFERLFSYVFTEDKGHETMERFFGKDWVEDDSITLNEQFDPIEADWFGASDNMLYLNQKRKECDKIRLSKEVFYYPYEYSMDLTIEQLFERKDLNWYCMIAHLVEKGMEEELLDDLNLERDRFHNTNLDWVKHDTNMPISYCESDYEELVCRKIE